ncbi:auxilin-related protein 2-like [Impatiens glandulifera]|uniref:auxilin-related protein 2-like n=1 Tax=Impatiens glandulifera TaxID=253017 RepID=UPI001FB16742|nr:auxilin-related protein 2-like [Impatiens glandulifera]
MDDFATLARDFGFRPHGKSAPMTASGIKIGVGTDGGDRGSSSSFLDKGNRDGFLFNDVAGGPTKNSTANYTNSKSASTLSDLDYDSIFKNSSSTTAVEKAKNESSSPVYDKPVYDEDIFNGLPGLKSKSTSFSVNFENVFASISSPPKSHHRSADFDDLHENFDRTAKSDAKNQKSTAGLDDLLPGFGGTSSTSSRPLSESNEMFSTANSTKPIPTAVEDPFDVMGSTSKSRVSSPDMFTNPLDMMGKKGHSGKTEVEESSNSGGVFDNLDFLNGFGNSVPTFQSEMNTEHNSSDSEPIRSSQFNGPESHLQKKMPYDDFQDPIFDVPQDSFDSHKFDVQNTSSYVNPSYNVDATSTSDEAWLTVSDFPIVTQVTRAPPPSRPPPPIPFRYPKDVRVKEYTKTSSRTKEAVQLEKDEQTIHDDQGRKHREMQESLENERRQKEEEEKELRRLDEENEQRRLEKENEQRRLEKERERVREIAREREKGRQAVERATREARERAGIEARDRASAEARQKAERTAVQRVQAEARERATVEARERAEKAVAEARERANAEAREKASVARAEAEAREKAAVARAEAEVRERAAVARAEAEARERAATEARERAATEARQRAERSAVQRVQAEARERASVEARERAEKAAVEARERANAGAREKETREKAAVARAEAEARRRAERAAVERVAADARERAAADARERAAAAAKTGQQKNDNDLDAFFSAGRASSAPRPTTNSRANSTGGAPEVVRTSSVSASTNTRKTSATTNIIDDLSSIFGAAPTTGGFQEVEGESEERRRARLERQQRTQERAAKALAEKNERDLQTLRDQEERHRIAGTLDFEIKRWAAGKEGNLRALLSTLQYVLWPECGWQPVSLTDLIIGASVKKYYRKATLCIHPDKVQQKGATLQQKYIAEKIFDLLKEAWNKFNSEELF